ncbi:MAG: CoA pyrophosphatase [Acidobacteria bacterium]|nr:CoA pyrophosphatase [Acidobacteriota bacterium]
MQPARIQALLQESRPVQLPIQGLKPAAVMIPILEDGTLLFTERAAHLPHHAGQISFPGGRIEPGESAQQAALRESQEEVGMQPGSVTWLGQLDDVYSPRGYHISCHVAWVRLQTFEPNPAEVSALHAVSCLQLWQAQRHSTKPWPARPEIAVHYFQLEPVLVWGVTGQILFNLKTRLDPIRLGSQI